MVYSNLQCRTNSQKARSAPTQIINLRTCTWTMRECRETHHASSMERMITFRSVNKNVENTVRAESVSGNTTCKNRQAVATTSKIGTPMRYGSIFRRDCFITIHPWIKVVFFNYTEIRTLLQASFDSNDRYNRTCRCCRTFQFLLCAVPEDFFLFRTCRIGRTRRRRYEPSNHDRSRFRS